MEKKSVKEKPKSIEWLERMDKVNLKRFGLWLNSNLHNSNKNVLVLFNLLRKWHPNFVIEKFDKTVLYDKVFGIDSTKTDSYKRNRINSLMGVLKKEIGKYWVYLRIKENEFLQLQLLNDQLINFQLFKDAEWVNRVIFSKLKNQSIRSSDDLYNRYNFYKNSYFKPDSYSQTDSSTIPLMLDSANQLLDEFYLLSKLRLLVEINERKSVYEGESKKIISNGYWLNMIKKSQNEAILFYFDFLSKTPIEKNDLDDLLGKFKNEVSKMDLYDQKIIIKLLINLTSRLNHQGVNVKNKKILNLYKVGLLYEILYEKGQLTSTTFANIVTLSNLCGEHDFAIDFVNKHKTKLFQDLQEDAYQWAQAHIAYHQKDAKKALHLIIKKRLETKAFEFRTRILKLQIYFDLALQEKGFVDVFYDYTIAFDKYIRRDFKSPEKRKESYQNFISFSRELMKLKLTKRFDIKTTNSIHKRLKGIVNIHGRSWLIKKIAWKTDPGN